MTTQPQTAQLQPGGLTAREVEVLGLLGRGNSTKEIGRQLAVSPKTAANPCRAHLRQARRLQPRRGLVWRLDTGLPRV